ncbi:hypothetical protein QUA42_15395, partial [Microcoleus sp. Pol11C2]|uniref:hypothetical protein n=1 Tax=Microcoleus sp. Pol11C2 TaxID=3055389 RepID=UPI002FD4E865
SGLTVYVMRSKMSYALHPNRLGGCYSLKTRPRQEHLMEINQLGGTPPSVLSWLSASHSIFIP